MSLKLIAVDGMTLSITAQSGSTVTPGKVTAGANDVTVVKNDNVSVGSKKVLVDKISFDSVHVSWGCTPVPPGAPTWAVNGSFQIIAGDTAVKADGKSCMLNGDSAMCSCSGSCLQGTTSTSFSGSCEIKISNAGQSSVKGE
jgi:uncharacterized Zn-binding protein involved in type VI secretion